MARQNMTRAHARIAARFMIVGVTAALIVPAFAQTTHRPNCITRYDGGKPYLFCEIEKKPAAVLKKRLEQEASRPTLERRSVTIDRGSAKTGNTVGPAKATPAGGENPFGSGGARPTLAASRTPASLRPVRALIEPAEMPPRGLAGYGVVAFTTRPLAQDAERNKFVCEAFKAVLVAQDELPGGTPLSDQMVTYWPVLNKNTPEALRIDCAHLMDKYALQVALDALGDADKSHEGLSSRRGPFLIAWAPSESRFVPDAVVLVMDMSSLESQRSFKEVFQDWRQRIVDNPQLWNRGFDIESVRRTIRDTFDRYGEGLVRLIKGS